MPGAQLRAGAAAQRNSDFFLGLKNPQPVNNAFRVHVSDSFRVAIAVAVSDAVDGAQPLGVAERGPVHVAVAVGQRHAQPPVAVDPGGDARRAYL